LPPNEKGMIPFDETGATLTTDELAAEQTGNPAGPDAEKRALPAFFAFASQSNSLIFVSADKLLLNFCRSMQ
jgi:hypothetical protein